MLLARYAVYAQAREIFINPIWTSNEISFVTLRHIAKEA
jgi:nitrilase